MRVADYIAERIAGLGVTHVFMVSGGGAMHLDDALSRRRDLTYVCDHHEQACAIAAEGYARVRGGPGVVCVTTGPGGTNTLTGVLGQWHDSIAALYVSGQVRYDTTVASTGLPLRQLGDQEADIVRLVAPITKYAAMVTDPQTVRYDFEKAVWLAQAGRPGPVWLDVPLDVQAAEVEPETLPGFDPTELDDGGQDPPGQSPGAWRGVFERERAAGQAREVVRRLRGAERPVVLAGSALRAAGEHGPFLRLIERLGVPVATAWNAHDLLWEGHPLYAGRPGTIGDRAGNFAVQNADLLLSLGCRLNVRQVGYEFRAFAHDAWRVVVDIDEAELAKPTIFPDLAVHADVGFFIAALERALDEPGAATTSTARPDWVAWCRERRRRYPAVLPEYRRRDEPVDAYVFVDELAGQCEEGELVVCANGAACVVAFQAFALKPRQRLIANSGTAGMGYDLPAALGAAFAAPGQRVICLAGDGSIQMNVQELQTIVEHELPVKIFVFNNGGYLSIRQTQDNLFDGHRMGEGPTTGVTTPDMVALAQAYGIPARRVTSHVALPGAIAATLAAPGPALCDVVMDPEGVFAPKAMAGRLADGRLVSRPLEDLHPFLERDELADNMIVAPYEPEQG